MSFVLLFASFFLSSSYVSGQLQNCSEPLGICATNACPTGSVFCNPQFEQGNQGWCQHAGNGSDVVSSIVNSDHSGKALKLIVTMTPSNPAFAAPLSDTAPHYATNSISLLDGFSSTSFEGSILSGFSSIRHCYHFVKGVTYKGSVWLKSNNPVVVEFLFRRGPDYYEAYAANRITITSTWKKYEISGGFDKDVDGSLEINILTPGTLYIDDADIVPDETILNKPLPSDTIPADFFGLHINKYYHGVTTRPAVGFGLLRLWDTVTRWFDLEPSDNNWEWTRLDHLVNLAKSEDPNTNVLYTLGMTPQWAAQYTALPSGNLFAPGATSPPGSITYWQDYVSKVVSHTAGKIKYYELWNEVDNGIFWGGSIDKMIELQNSAWNILHPANDSIDDYLLSPNITNNGLRWLEEYLEKGGGETVDIFAFHYYPEGMIENGIPYIESVKSILRRKGYCCETDPECTDCKPLWNTEGSNSFEGTLSPELQRAHVSRSYIVQWAFGIGNFSWYMWENESGNYDISLSQKVGESWDLTTPTTAGDAYRITRNWLVGSRMVTKIISGNTTWKIKITKENGATAWIVWDTAGSKNIDQPENWSTMSWTTLAGAKNPVQNIHSIPISEEPILLEEGSGGGFAGRVAADKPEVKPEAKSEEAQNPEALLSAYPNPFSVEVTIRYAVPQDTHVTITIYDSFGIKVSSPVNEYQPAGEHSIVFRSDKLSHGMYLCEYKTATRRIVSKITLMR